MLLKAVGTIHKSVARSDTKVSLMDLLARLDGKAAPLEGAIADVRRECAQMDHVSSLVEKCGKGLDDQNRATPSGRGKRLVHRSTWSKPSWGTTSRTLPGTHSDWEVETSPLKAEMIQAEARLPGCAGEISTCSLSEATTEGLVDKIQYSQGFMERFDATTEALKMVAS